MPDAPSPMNAAPGGSAMLTPQEPAGQKEGAKVKVLMAMKVLETALPEFGAASDEGKAVLSAIKGLASKFGQREEKTDELMPAEIKQLLQGVAGPGAAQGGPPPGAAPGVPPGGAPPPGAGAPPM